MKQTKIFKLIERYLTNKTTVEETAKFDAVLRMRKQLKIEWVSMETEDLLADYIRSKKKSINDICTSMKSLIPLRVKEIEWMKQPELTVYFSKDAYP